MAVCNLFSKLTKIDGTFLTFSQYLEDLNKSATQGGVYRTVPSRYIALNINYNNISVPEEEDINEYIPRLFQNYFENACAFLKTETDYWNSSNASNIFWDFLIKYNFIHLDENQIIEEGKFVGNIDIQSFNQHDGMGYGEVFCYIGESDKAQSVELGMSKSDKDSLPYDNTIVMGYADGDYKPDSNMCKLNIEPGTHYGEEYIYNINEVTPIDPQPEQVSFNTIIILYDTYINNESGNLIAQYKDVPMGIYFSGIMKDSNMTNNIVKYIKNDDIYGSGTAYGLRICTRFVVTSLTDNIINVDVNTDNGQYAAFCYVMGQMAETINKLNTMIDGNISGLNQFKQFYNYFKNREVNVPYIKVIKDKSYWFVNGKNTGTAAIEGMDITIDNELSETSINPVQNKIITTTINTTNEQLTDAIANIQKLDDAVFPLSLSVTGGGLFELGTTQNITLTWELTKSGTPVEITAVYINDEMVPNANNSYVFNDVTTTTDYKVKVVSRETELESTAKAEFIGSKYFGFSEADDSSLLNIEGLIKQLLSKEVAGEYDLENSTDGYYLWLCVPNEMQIESVTSDGFEIPMEQPADKTTESGINYKCYRSSSSINQGNLTIIIK